MHFDIFNGDADGIISLLQLRLANPIESTLITGIKRDIRLVEKIKTTANDSATILDISMEKNVSALVDVLDSGAEVFYADHHQSGEIPNYPNLNAHINLDANVCTALIVDQVLNGQYRLWAITAAYGDNMVAKANQLATELGLTRVEMDQLSELGMLLNYNGYGANLDELHYHPADLYTLLKPYSSPLMLISDINSPYYTLKQAFHKDMKQALGTSIQSGLNSTWNLVAEPNYKSDYLSVYKLTASISSRRISGVMGNILANQNQTSAHAILTENSNGTYTVSLRSPLNNKQGAGRICSRFETGGGREAAGGINELPEKHIQAFIDIVEAEWGRATS